MDHYDEYKNTQEKLIEWKFAKIKSWFTDKLSIDLGARVIRIGSCLKNTASIVANMVNRCIQDLKNKKNVNFQVALHHEETPLEKLEKLANLHKWELYLMKSLILKSKNY